MKNSFRGYTGVYFLIMALAVIPLSANYFFMIRSEEISPLRETVDFQQRHQSIFGPALMSNIWGYKLEMVRMRKPEVVALGSSRMMALTSDAFSVPFINAGGGMLGPEEGLAFVREMLQLHKPRILIVGVDSFWFTPRHLILQNPHTPDENTLDRVKLVSPFLWLAEGKIGLGNYMRVLCRRPAVSPWVGYDLEGAMAIGDATGFRSDGSRFYGSRYAEKSPSGIDYNWRRLIKMAENNQTQFETGDRVDEKRFAALMELAAVCRTNHVSLVLILTPPSLSAYRIMQSQLDRFKYVTDVKARLSKPGQSFEFYDVMDLSRIGSSDCECTDASHPGNTAYDKILRSILAQNPKSVLSGVVDRAALDRLIERFNGRALALSDMSQIHFKEVDFLGLDCRKGS